MHDYGLYESETQIFRDSNAQLAQPVQEAGIDHFHFPDTFTDYLQ